MTQHSRHAFIEALKRNTKCRVLVPSDELFASAIALWNGAVTERPAAMIRCQDITDIQRAVVIAREHAMPVSVLGGGHDWAGRALRQGALTIDLRSMRKVSVDASNGTALLQGGATADDLLNSASPNLAAVTGTVKAVGMTGLTLGGGYGPLNGSYGLALDNLLSAEVVLADGSLAFASEVGNADLFWAVRGGGGNFGVITSMTLRLHEVPQVLSALILFPLPYAHSVLQRYQEILNAAPEELGLLAGFLAGPDGSPMLFLAPLWSGRIADAEQVLAELTSLEGAISVHRGLSPYRDALEIFDPLIVNGRHHFIETRTLASLDEVSISSLIESARNMSSPVSGIVIHDFHGAGTRVAPDATAFPLRQNHLVVEIVSAWNASATDDGAAHRDWARALSESLATSALSGGYVNLLAPDSVNRAKQFYGEALPRLKRVKQTLDPDNVFQSGVGVV
jgi:FAD/FMN-containing dehydrogenase